MLRSLLLGTLIVPCFLMPSAALESWPAFRGPTADGHAAISELPIEWSTDRNVAWKTPLQGRGWSTPVISGDQLFVTGAVPIAGERGDLSLRMMGLHRGTGEIEVDVEVFRQHAATAPAIHSKNSHASPTPVIDGDRIVVHFGHQGTACLDHTGRIIWTNRDFRYTPVHGNGGSPTVVGDVVAFSCDGGDEAYVVGLDKYSGKLKWRHARQAKSERTFSFSTPAVINVDGRQQLISPGSGTVEALDPATGELIWHVRHDGYSVIPQPVFGHGLVFVCTGYDQPSLLAIRPTGRGDVTDTHVAWRSDRFIPHTPSVLLVGDELYMVSDRGVASCRDAHTGELHWQHRLTGGFSASPILAADRIYFLNEEGDTTVVRAGKSYVELATNSIGERTLASFAAVDGRLFIRGERTLYCFTNPR